MAKKTMELNPSHPIVQALKTKFGADSADKSAKDLVFLLYETALLTSGFSLDNPASFSGRIHKLIRLGLSIEQEAEEAEDDGESDDEPPALENEDMEAHDMEDVD